MHKKSQLSLKTIIIAAIVLIVLVVIWAIFTGRIGTFSEGLEAKESERTSAVKDIKSKLGLDTSSGSCKISSNCDGISGLQNDDSDCATVGCDYTIPNGPCTGSPSCPSTEGECNNLPYSLVCEWS